MAHLIDENGVDMRLSTLYFTIRQECYMSPILENLMISG